MPTLLTDMIGGGITCHPKEPSPAPPPGVRRHGICQCGVGIEMTRCGRWVRLTPRAMETSFGCSMEKEMKRGPM